MGRSRQNGLPGVWRVLGIVSLVGLAFGVGWHLGSPGTRQSEPSTSVEVRLTSLSGGDVGLRDLLGEVVVVDFWTTWCGPCRLQAEILEDLFLEYASQGVQFLAVSVAEEAEIVREFVADQPFRYPVLLDYEEKLSEPLGVFMFPTVMIVDRKGQVAYLRAGISPAETLRQELSEVGVDLG